MLIDLLLPDVPGLALQGYSAEDDGITLIMASTCSAACCPLCGFASNREHSHYQRAPGDLPWSRLRILLRAELFGNDPGISVRIKRWRAGRRKAPNNKAVDYPNNLARNTASRGENRRAG
jgi:hypothetical protein